MCVFLSPREVNRCVNNEVDHQDIYDWKSRTLFKYYEKKMFSYFDGVTKKHRFEVDTILIERFRILSHVGKSHKPPSA